MQKKKLPFSIKKFIKIDLFITKKKYQNFIIKTDDQKNKKKSVKKIEKKTLIKKITKFSPRKTSSLKIHH